MKTYTVLQGNRNVLKTLLVIFIGFHIQLAVAQESILDKEVSISFSNQNLEGVIKQIESETGYSFSYAPDAITKKVTVDKTFSNVTLRELLTEILVEYSIFYRVSGTTIQMYTDAVNGLVIGTISDQAGEPLPFVNIAVRGTSFGGSSNESGQFSFYAPEGEHIIIASSVGYRRMEKPVSILSESSVSVDFELTTSSVSLKDVTVLGEREIGYVAVEQVGATFGERKIVDIPQSVTVITQEVLLDQQVRTLGDIVRNDPSVIVSNLPGFYENINVRGFELDNLTSYRRENLVYVNQARNPFENKASVEIIKGPSAIRYGFTPPGGIVNYVLKRPTESPYNFIQTFADTNGSIGIHGDFGGTVNEKFGYRINAVVAQDASFINDVSGPRQMFSTFFEWRPIKNLRIDIESEYQGIEIERQSAIRVGSFAESVTDAERRQLLDSFDRTTFLGQSWAVQNTSNFINSIGANYQISENWSVQSNFQHMDLNLITRPALIRPGTLQANGNYDIRVVNVPVEFPTFSLEGFIKGKLNTFGLQHEVAFGGSYTKVEFNRSSPIGDVDLGPSNIFNPIRYDLPDFATGAVSDFNTLNQKAVYITDFIGITENLELLAGIRYTEQENRDIFNDTGSLRTSYKDNFITPNFGIIYSLFDSTSIYASYSTGVTQGAEIPVDATNFGDETFLDPIETEQFEFGVKTRLFKNAQLTAAYFNIDLPLAFLDGNNIFRYGGSQQNQGLELTLSGEVSERIRVILGGLYMDAEIDNPIEPNIDGNRPISEVEFQGNLYVDYKIPVKGLAMNAGLFYTGERFADNENTFSIDGYTRFDLGARYGFNLGATKMTARVNVRNLFNADFVEGIWNQLFTFGAPATAVFSLAAEL